MICMGTFLPIVDHRFSSDGRSTWIVCAVIKNAHGYAILVRLRVSEWQELLKIMLLQSAWR